MYKKIAILLLYTDCGIFDGLNKPQIQIDVKFSYFSKSVLIQMDQNLINKFELNY